MSQLEIRQETAQDYAAVYQLVKDAFASAEHCDGNEQELVSALRASSAFIPELSLVAVADGNIVGHILFTKVLVGEHTALALAPLSVRPAYQRQGVGFALMKAGHSAAQKLGYDYSIVLGSSKYYPKIGYVPASTYGILSPFDVPDENFMALRLTDGAKALNGTVKYDKAFGID